MRFARHRAAIAALAILSLCLLSALAVLALAADTAPAPFDSAAAITKGRALREALRINDAQRIWDECDDRMREFTGGNVEGMEKLLKQVTSQVGKLQECLQDSVRPQAGSLRYTAWCRYENAPMPLVLTFVFDATGKIAGMWVRPDAKPYPTAFADYQTKTALKLPFHGEWTVIWGGRTLQDNYHVFTRDQRFAYDIVVVRDSSSHAGEGRSNSDYYCFGLPIVAPAAGKVVWLQDGIADNNPGRMNPQQAVGNSVVLDHGNGEFSVLAHFKRGSIRVKRDQQVAEGDTLALCGNSGNSSEPHLHYHLQNGPDLFVWDGLPAPFTNFVADGAKVEKGEPVRNQKISRQE